MTIMSDLIFDSREKNETPDVSIIIPHFERPDELRRAIESCLLQHTIKVEIIVVDDASSHLDTEQLSDYSNLVLIKLMNRSGAPVARNVGLKNSRAEYILFLDSDDYLQEDRLEQLLCELRTRRLRGVVALSGSFVISRLGNSSSEIVSETRVFRHVTPLTPGIVFSRNPIGPLSKVIFVRSVVDSVCGFDPDLPACQDWDLYIRISAKGFIETAPIVVTTYFAHGDSITGNYNKGVKGRLMLFKKHAKLGTRFGIVFIVQSFYFFLKRWGFLSALRASMHYPLAMVSTAALSFPIVMMYLIYKRRTDFVKLY